eukprot:7386585-Prymnesium_polylepis.4
MAPRSMYEIASLCRPCPKKGSMNAWSGGGFRIERNCFCKLMQRSASSLIDLSTSSTPTSIETICAAALSCRIVKPQLRRGLAGDAREPRRRERWRRESWRCES